MPTRRPPDPALLLRDALAVGMVLLFGAMPFPVDEFRAEGAALVPALLPAALILLRRRWPVVVLVAVTLCAAGVALAGAVSPGAMAAVAIAAFSVAERRSRVIAVIAVSASVIALLLIHAVPLHGDFFDPRAMQLLLFVVVGAALGDATRSRRAFAGAMRERAERAERSREDEARRRVAEERVSLARDLHDVVAHQIAVISLNAGVASSALDIDPERARTALQTVRIASRTVLADVGGLMSLLRDGEDAAAARPHLGLGALDDLVERFDALGFPVRVDRDAWQEPLPTGVDLVSYLVVQEGLTNAHKHGDGSGAAVEIRRTPTEVSVMVSNPPRRDAPTRAHGHGLRGLTERVDAVRGRLRTRADPGVFRLHAVLPVRDEARA